MTEMAADKEEERSRLISSSPSFLNEQSESSEVRKTYGSIPAYAISINYIIGTGVFSLPFAFYSSGLALGLACLVVSGFFSVLCLNWVIETLARADGVTQQEYFSDNPPPIHQITFRKFDFTRLFQIFIGWKAKIFCQLVISLYCYGVLWAFSAVFASSTSSILFQFAFNEQCDVYSDPSENCSYAYYGFLGLYFLIVVPLACLDMTEQAAVQTFLTFYRFSAFGVMLVTVIIGLSSSSNPFAANPSKHVAYTDLLHWVGFPAMFTSAAVACNFHYNVPDIVPPIRYKESVARIELSALTTAILFYIVVGVLCCLFFGSAAYPLITLNWQTYTGSGGGWSGSVEDRPAWAIVIQLWVMLFPICDMVSVFPLCAVTLGNNILESLPENFRAKHQNRARLLKTLCRLAAAIPPVILAAALKKLDKIFSFTGLFAFFLELLFPCILQIISSRYCTKRWGPRSADTPYSTFFSKPGFAVVTFIFGAAALIFAVYLFGVSLFDSK